MQATSIATDVQAKERHVTHRINAFIQQFKIGTLAHRCGITKAKGVSPTTILLCLFSLPFQRLNLYRYFSTDGAPEFGKDAVYEFMRSSRFSWRRFLLLVATRACGMLSALTSEKRETVLILDDSTFQRPRSKRLSCWPAFSIIPGTASSRVSGFSVYAGPTAQPSCRWTSRCCLRPRRRIAIRASPNSSTVDHAEQNAARKPCASLQA